jgi:transposase InsO family protein
MDILGTFPRAIGGFWYIYVTIDKFTRWSEATPLVRINKQSIVKFIESIVCRVGVPNRIITDNGSQFTSSASMDTVRILASKSAMHPLLIQRVMDRSRDPMLKSSRASRRAPLTS